MLSRRIFFSEFVSTDDSNTDMITNLLHSASVSKDSDFSRKATSRAFDWFHERRVGVHSGVVLFFLAFFYAGPCSTADQQFILTPVIHTI